MPPPLFSHVSVLVTPLSPSPSSHAVLLLSRCSHFLCHLHTLVVLLPSAAAAVGGMTAKRATATGGTSTKRARGARRGRRPARKSAPTRRTRRPWSRDDRPPPSLNVHFVLTLQRRRTWTKFHLFSCSPPFSSTLLSSTLTAEWTRRDEGARSSSSTWSSNVTLCLEARITSSRFPAFAQNHHFLLVCSSCLWWRPLEEKPVEFD